MNIPRLPHDKENLELCIWGLRKLNRVTATLPLELLSLRSHTKRRPLCPYHVPSLHHCVNLSATHVSLFLLPFWALPRSDFDCSSKYEHYLYIFRFSPLFLLELDCLRSPLHISSILFIGISFEACTYVYVCARVSTSL